MHRKPFKALALLIPLLLGSLWLAISPLAARPFYSLERDDGLADDGPISEPAVVRIYVRDRDHLNAVAGELDIWEAYPDKGFVVAAVSPAEYLWLEDLGYELQVDAAKTARFRIQAPLDPRFHYYDDFYVNPNGRYIVDYLQGVAADHPELAELYDIGDAWMADQPGEHDRDIWVLRITNEDPSFGAIDDKPAFYLFATVHAREVAVTELAIRYIRYLTEGYNGEGGYGVDPDVTWLVDHNVAYVLVVQNPDGHWQNELNTSNDRRKNMDWDDGCSYSSSWGTDLNRNSSFFWGCCGGSSGDPCSTTYRGPSGGSEPETQAFQNHFGVVMQDQNGPNTPTQLPPAAPDDTTGIFITMHSYSDLVLWPWGFQGYGNPPNYAQLQTIGRKLAAFTNYDPSGSIWYDVDGATDDWVYGMFGIPSFTFEVGSSGGACGGFFPSYDCIDGTNNASRNFWAENKPAFLWSHKIARTPYMTAYGPDAGSVVMMPGAVAPGAQTLLSATVDDFRYGSDPHQPIVAAEYFVGGPGADGAGVSMSPSDGSWGGITEGVEATIDTTGLAPGRHYVLVHGQNSNGDWGPFSAAFVYVVEPGVSPVIEGYVRDASTNAPLEATVTAGSFQANSDPATGFYSMTVVSSTYQMSAVAAGHAISTVTGVVAPDYTTVRQDFGLFPICQVLSDDVESGNIGWTVQSPWAITEEGAHSPTHSWTESPGTNYGNYRNVSLTSPALDLTGYEGVVLDFWHIYDTEPGYDYGYVEYSINGGATWSTAASYAGYGHTSWTNPVIPLTALDGQANARIRFRFYSDSSVTADGWHLDDILLTGGGPACGTVVSPTAAFESNSPVVLGDPVVFANLSTGTMPMDYAWDFGDGVGTSTDSDPAYLYAAEGMFTVTLTATNGYGSDTFSDVVTVLPNQCIELTAADLALVTPGALYPGAPVEMSVDLAPDYATKPYTYTVDYGDGSLPMTGTSSLDPLALFHTYEMTGTFDVQLEVWNCAMVMPVTDTIQLTIQETAVCTEVTGVDLTLLTTGDIYTDTLVEFSADIIPDDASLPYSYTIDLGDGSALVFGVSDQDPLMISHTFQITGTLVVQIAVWNCGMTAPVTDTLSITVLPEPPAHLIYMPIISKNQ